MEMETSSSENDPQQPSSQSPRSYVPSKIPPQDLPFNYATFLAVVFLITGLIFRYKLFSWLAVFFSAMSLAKIRFFEDELKRTSMAMMFAIMGLVTLYFGSSSSANQQP